MIRPWRRGLQISLKAVCLLTLVIAAYGGGYSLARPQHLVSIADIIRAVDEPIDATQCGGKQNCLDDHRCMTHELWANLNAHIYSFLSSVTLANMVEQQQHEQKVRVLRDRRAETRKTAAPLA